MSVVIKHLIEESTELYNPSDELVGIISNNLQLIDVRVQIKEQKLEGYYFLFRGEKYYIDKDGRGYWHKDFFSMYSKLLDKLF